MGYLGNQITTVFPTSISVDSATISGNASVGGTSTLTGAVTTGTSLTVANGLTLSDGNVTVADGHGISFVNASGSASGSATSLLDDYEEGTWTPTVNSGTISVVSGSARYVKIGNLVTVYTRITTFSDTTSGTAFYIQSLPFTVNTAHNDANIGTAWGNSLGDHRSMFFFSQTNSTQTLGYYGGAGSTFNQVLYSDFTSNTDILIRLHYITA